MFFQCAWGLTPCANGTNDFAGVLALPAGRGGNFYIGARLRRPRGPVLRRGRQPTARGRSSSCRWADLLLTNTSSPAASGFSGSLLSPDAHGTADLAFTATDPNGPGVYRVTVQIDGNTVYSATPNTNQGQCAPVGTDPTTGALMFDWQQPCLQTETVDLPIDTTALADGQHELKVIVTDAGAEQLDRARPDDHHAQQHDRQLAAALPARSDPRRPCTRSSLDAATKRLTRGVRRLYSHSASSSPARSRDARASPHPACRSACGQQPASGGDFSELAHTTTNGAGAWTLTAPRGSSRLLRVVAGAKAQAASAASSVSVRETVTPVLSLHVATPGGGRIVFTGRLAIAPLGQPRPLVFIQTRGPDGWEEVGSPVRVDPDGAFRYVYRSSPLTSGGSFSFRAETPATGLWDAALSPTREAVVH